MIKSALVFAGGAMVIFLGWTALGGEKAASLALSGRDIAALSARSSYPLEDILERAKVLGVSVVALKEESAASAVERGDMLQFSRPELEKWRAMGLIAAGAPARPGSLWIKDKDTLSRLAEAAARRRIAMSTSSAGGYHAVDFPPGVDLSSLSLGLEPELMAAVKKAGLFPAAESVAMREVFLEDGCGEALRAAFERPAPLLLWRFSSALDGEGNFDALRHCAGRLTALGVSLSEPLAGQDPPRRRAPALWLLMALGPLLAARAGLLVLRRARRFAQSSLPHASPVLEIAAATLAAGGAATVIGLAINSLGGVALHDPAMRWQAFAALGAPLALGVIALYASDLPCWGMILKTPLTPAAVLRAGGVLVLLAALRPGHHLTPWMNRMTSLFEPLWWWPWRWRELFVGFPCLLAAHAELNRLWGCSDCDEEAPKKGDARVWLLLGLLGPAGMIAALGDSAVPFGLGLAQAWLSLFLGSALGALAAAARAKLC